MGWFLPYSVTSLAKTFHTRDLRVTFSFSLILNVLLHF